MAELRITVKPPDDVDGARRNEMLDALARRLQEGLQLDQPPAVMPDIGDDGLISPMFLLTVRDAETTAATLRSVGTWYMAHPGTKVVIKVTGRGGRVALEITRFSTVAFAEAATKIHNAVVGGPGD